MTTFILEAHVGDRIIQLERMETESNVFCFTSEKIIFHAASLIMDLGTVGFSLHVMRIMHDGVHGTVDIDRIWGYSIKESHNEKQEHH